MRSSRWPPRLNPACSSAARSSPAWALSASAAAGLAKWSEALMAPFAAILTLTSTRPRPAGSSASWKRVVLACRFLAMPAARLETVWAAAGVGVVCWAAACAGWNGAAPAAGLAASAACGAGAEPPSWLASPPP